MDDPAVLLSKMQERESSDRYLSIGTDWHALHFLLTGDGELKPHPLPPPPLGNVMHGGTETQWSCSVRSLAPDEVRAVADALGTISVGEKEMSWRFEPRQAWQAMEYMVRVDELLEDLAGNTPVRVFDTDLEKPKGPPAKLALPFRPRK